MSMLLFQSASEVSSTGRRRGDAGVRDEDVDAAEFHGASA
jgi:hypothetical protein